MKNLSMVVDIGSTSVKGILVDDNNNIVSKYLDDKNIINSCLNYKRKS